MPVTNDSIMSDHTWDWLLARLWLKKHKNIIKHIHK